jgi:hypothetical protein
MNVARFSRRRFEQTGTMNKLLKTDTRHAAP